MPQRSENRIKQVFGERVKSLIEDGYCLRVKSETETLLYARLKHMSNGNEIKVYGHPLNRTLEQYTNNVLTHYQEE